MQDFLLALDYSLVVFENLVISFLETTTPIFDPVLARIEKGMGRIRGAEQDYLAWALMDAVVDNYFGVIDGVDQQLSDLDDALVIAHHAIGYKSDDTVVFRHADDEVAGDRAF